MKVLIVLASANRRGAEIEGTELARQLVKIGEQAEVVALAPSSGAVALDVEVLGATPLGRQTLQALRRRAIGFDVVVAYGSSTLPACAIALLGTRVPFVYRSIGDPTRWSRGGLHRLRTALLFHRAKTVVALWPAAADAITELYRVPRRRIEVIPNARDEEIFRPPTPEERADARRALGVFDDVKVIAFIGALSDEKRPMLAIEAAMLVDGAQLMIAGDGPLRSAVETAASQTDGRVQVLGSVDDVRVLLYAADVLLNTSSTEGMPGSLIEAAMCGVPIVATDVGAVSSISHGILVVPSEASATLIARELSGVRRPSILGASDLGWASVVARWSAVLAAAGPLAR